MINISPAANAQPSLYHRDDVGHRTIYNLQTQASNRHMTLEKCPSVSFIVLPSCNHTLVKQHPIVSTTSCKNAPSWYHTLLYPPSRVTTPSCIHTHVPKQSCLHTLEYPHLLVSIPSSNYKLVVPAGSTPSNEILEY